MKTSNTPSYLIPLCESLKRIHQWGDTMRTMEIKQAHLNAAVGNMLSTFTFQLGGVLDARRHMIHHINAAQLEQLLRAYQDYTVYKDDEQPPRSNIL